MYIFLSCVCGGRISCVILHSWVEIIFGWMSDREDIKEIVDTKRQMELIGGKWERQGERQPMFKGYSWKAHKLYK